MNGVFPLLNISLTLGSRRCNKRVLLVLAACGTLEKAAEHIIQLLSCCDLYKQISTLNIHSLITLVCKTGPTVSTGLVAAMATFLLYATYTGLQIGVNVGNVQFAH